MNYGNTNNASNSNSGKVLSLKSSRNGRLIKSKLLNLHQLLKQKVADGSDDMEVVSRNVIHDIDDSHPNKSVPSFIIRKPINMNGYDYSVFTNYPTEIDLQHGEHLPPAIKESQIKSWELAERISTNVIFGNSSESEDDIDELDEDEHTEASRSSKVNLRKNNVIQAIPGYTRGELDIIQSSYSSLQHTSVSSSRSNTDTKHLLYEYKKQVQMNQERLFSQAHSVSTRRQLQISQKKEVLQRLFGYSNSLNQEYITNNSSYSSIDNTANLQKIFHEDRDEIKSLLDEERASLQALEETKLSLRDLKNSSIGSNIKHKRRRGSNMNMNSSNMNVNMSPLLAATDFDYDKFHSVTSRKLDKLYDGYLAEHDLAEHLPSSSRALEEDDDLDASSINEELQLFTLSFLRKCIKNEVDDGYNQDDF